MRRLVIVASISLMTALGCQKDRTEVIVGLATDLAVPKDLSQLLLEVHSVPDSGYPIFGPIPVPVSNNNDVEYVLPATWGIYSQSGSADRFRVLLTAQNEAGDPVVVRSAVMNLVPQQTLFLRLGLVSACKSMTDCCQEQAGCGLTCIEGECVSEDIDSSRLPIYEPGMENAVSCTSGTTFRNTASGAPLPATGSSCPIGGTCLDGVCLTPPVGDGGADAAGPGGAGGGNAGGAGGGNAAGAGGSGGAGATNLVYLTSNAMGFVQNASAGVVGYWFPYGDGVGADASGDAGADPGQSDCELKGGFPMSDCSQITSPVPGQPFQPSNLATSRMCTSGIAAKVMNKSGAPDYGDLWGAGIALNFNDPTGQSAGEANLAAYKGISFDFTADSLPVNSMRVNFPFTGQHAADAPYWEGATTDYSPLTGTTAAPQHVEIDWPDVGGPFYLTEQSPPIDLSSYAFNPSAVQTIQFQVFTNTTSTTPYSFCVANLALVPNLSTGGTTGRGGSGGSAGTGSGGNGGAAGAKVGCQASDPPPTAAIAFGGEDASLQIMGGFFVYGDSPLPGYAISSGMVNVTDSVQISASSHYQGFGIYFNGNASGTDCVNASGYTGIEFDISGTLMGIGCSIQYSTNDSEHADSTAQNTTMTGPNDLKASGPKGSYAPQIQIPQLTSTPMTIRAPFSTAIGGSPNQPLDPTRLDGIQWQISSPTASDGGSTECVWNMSLSNVSFYH
jgi:hypothetical protein